MHRTVGRVTQLFAVLIVAALGIAAQKTDEPKSLFNGKDLTGWDGDTTFWSVEEGVITGRTTADKPAKQNTFLIWKDGTVRDFELRLKYKISNHNSGVQYRSKDWGSHVVTGYQADIDDGGKYSGILYEEKGRGILANRGEEVVIPAGGKPKVVGKLGETSVVGEAVKKGDWNEYVIIAKGNHLRHFVNGVQTVDVVDNDPKGSLKSGILALQLHAGAPMKVEFKDIRLKHFAADSK